MRPAVLAGFPAWTAQFEGRLPYMYTDKLGLVTCAVGNLADPLSLALVMPWQNPDGSAASAANITSCWQAVKYAFPTIQSVLCKKIPDNNLRLTDAAIDALVQQRLRLNETLTIPHFLNWENLPAKVQLAILSMDWAMGAGAWNTWPHFVAAVNLGDYAGAAAESQMLPTPGIGPRNAADKALLLAAALPGDDPDAI